MTPARPVRGFLFDLLVAFALMLLFGAVAGIAWGAAFGFGPEPDPMAMLAIVAVATGGASLVVYYWRRRATSAERAASSAAARRPSTWGWAVLVAAAVFATSTGVHWLLEGAGVELAPTNAEFIEAGLAARPALLLAFAVLLAPAYEELLFRRVLFGRFLAAGKPWLGIVLSSAVFALMHELPGTGGNPLEATLALWGLYAAMGAAFAWVYWRTGTLWAAFAAHALNNLVSCLLVLGTLG